MKNILFLKLFTKFYQTALVKVQRTIYSLEYST
jgi:hypothetical protein